MYTNAFYRKGKTIFLSKRRTSIQCVLFTRVVSCKVYRYQRYPDGWPSGRLIGQQSLVSFFFFLYCYDAMRLSTGIGCKKKKKNVFELIKKSENVVGWNIVRKKKNIFVMICSELKYYKLFTLNRRLRLLSTWKYWCFEMVNVIPKKKIHCGEKGDNPIQAPRTSSFI